MKGWHEALGLRVDGLGLNIGDSRITYAIVGAPYYPKTLFYLLRPLH